LTLAEPSGVRAQSKTNSVRLRGSTGTSSPAIRAVSAARGPEALTTVPACTTAPDFSVTDVTRAPSRPIATTSSVTRSAPCARALARKPFISPVLENQPSPDCP